MPACRRDRAHHAAMNGAARRIRSCGCLSGRAPARGAPRADSGQRAHHAAHRRRRLPGVHGEQVPARVQVVRQRPVQRDGRAGADGNNPRQDLKPGHQTQARRRVTRRRRRSGAACGPAGLVQAPPLRLACVSPATRGAAQCACHAAANKASCPARGAGAHLDSLRAALSQEVCPVGLQLVAIPATSCVTCVTCVTPCAHGGPEGDRAGFARCFVVLVACHAPALGRVAVVARPAADAAWLVSKHPRRQASRAHAKHTRTGNHVPTNKAILLCSQVSDQEPAVGGAHCGMEGSQRADAE